MIRPLLLAATLLLPPAVQAQGVAGPYLAARIAGFGNDHTAAAEYYATLLEQDHATPQVLENALIIYSVLGDFRSAREVADRMDESGQVSQFAASARMVAALQDGRFGDARDLLSGDGVGGALLDGLLAAWIEAADGDMGAALDGFDRLAETESFAPFAQMHKAFALAQAGDFEGADAIFSGEENGPLNATTRGIEAHAQVLAQLGRSEDALELLQKANEVTNSATLRDLEDRIAAGERPPYDVVATPMDGMAEAYFTLAALLMGDSSVTFTLLNARAALALRPTHVEGLLLTADLLEGQEQYALAAEVFAAVPRDDPGFHEAEIARADVLLASGQDEAAIEVLSSLTRSNGEEIDVWAAYADALRRLERFAPAAVAYDRSIDMLPEVTPRHWFLFYARGVAHEQLDEWPAAEADFRRALDLNPDQPNVLNYLGYGLVEQRSKLDEALDMIERAVAARPDDGYITDSLAWVYYRLGRHEDAVEPMERAVMLNPLDPLINDHLGDVLWSVGRKREAEFQWRRALSLDPKEEIDRIRRKLEVGLDRVLEEEGEAGPIEAADR
ncbi:tetratricopeptide repeat protein [Jannaschia rubra]|uniref:Bacteriophage N4 receptor, outer membrane subunit n=1 Tax=Jannaschia rubra TaxID=282197 RepID=A0A0M6XMB9_9RHOB|nr:tetratricopeptide repeat protein [Jannaschia rubra]CTQ32296.1 bacteriophage N4 receptor, outer membrane subunit [Jannaschia rubra]SFG47866.1 TPR repeat-containing protein [Jannaschia rubra]